MTMCRCAGFALKFLFADGRLRRHTRCPRTAGAAFLQRRQPAITQHPVLSARHRVCASCVHMHHCSCMCLTHCCQQCTCRCRWVRKAPGWPFNAPLDDGLRIHYTGGRSFWHWYAVSAARAHSTRCSDALIRPAAHRPGLGLMCSCCHAARSRAVETKRRLRSSG